MTSAPRILSREPPGDYNSEITVFHGFINHQDNDKVPSIGRTLVAIRAGIIGMTSRVLLVVVFYPLDQKAAALRQ